MARLQASAHRKSLIHLPSHSVDQNPGRVPQPSAQHAGGGLVDPSEVWLGPPIQRLPCGSLSQGFLREIYGFELLGQLCEPCLALDRPDLEGLACALALA